MGCVADNGIVYTVMESLEGKSVNDLVSERGPIGVAEACRMAINVLDALRDVHRAGFIHRDVKPHNIIRVDHSDTSWVYKLIDFGSATGALGQERKGLPAYVTVTEPASSSSSSLPAEPWSTHTEEASDGASEEASVGVLTCAPNDALRPVFDSIDSQQTGVLDLDDVLRSLRSLGLRIDRALVSDLVGQYDRDGNGLIDFQEFGQMYGAYVSLPYSAYSRSEDNIHILRHAFRALTGGSEQMTLGMLNGCFTNLQRQMPPDRIRDLFTKYDINGDGKLEEAEFVPMFGELVAMQDAMNWSGTHGYMSPEQYTEEVVSPASDVWAVGATLYKITCGQTPYTVTGGTWGKGIVGDKTQEAPPLSNVLFNVPPSFSAVVSKALRKDPAERYSSAAEMREALALVLNDLGPIQAKPYMNTWESAAIGDSEQLYTHGVVWEKPPRR